MSSIKAHQFSKPGNAFIFVLALFVLVVTLLGALPNLFRPIDGDESIYFYYSRYWLRGGGFFDEFWHDDKPGMLQIIWAFLINSDNPIASFYNIRLFAFAYQIFTVAAFYKLVRVLRVGNIAEQLLFVLIFAVVYLNPLVQGDRVNANNFVVLPILVCAICFVREKYLYAALCIGFSFSIKQNTALEILPASVLLWATGVNAMLARGDYILLALLRATKPLFQQFFVFLAPITSLGCLALFDGNFLRFIEVSFIDRVSSHILHKDYSAALKFGVPIAEGFLVLLVGAVGFFVSGCANIIHSYRPSVKLVLGGFDRYLLLWIFFGSVSVWVGGYFFPHYFLEIVPILVLAGCIFLSRAPWFLLSVVVYSCWIYAGLDWGSGLIFLALCWLIWGASVLSGCTSSYFCKLILILVTVLYSSPSNPLVKFWSQFKSSEFLDFYYTDRDLNIRDAARFLSDRNSDSIFVYDYVMEIYSLAGIVSPIGVAPKFHFIDFSKVILDNKNYEDDSDLLASNASLLLASIEKSEFDYIVINFASIRDAEFPFVNSMLERMSDYQAIKSFDQVWIYARVSGARSSQTGERISASRVSVRDGYLEIVLDMESLSPILSAELRCGGLDWRFPENGLQYPMKILSGLNKSVVTARLRGSLPEACKFQLIQVGGSRTIDLSILGNEQLR